MPFETSRFTVLIERSLGQRRWFALGAAIVGVLGFAIVPSARRASGEFEARRRHQALDWMWDIVHAGLRHAFDQHPSVRAALPDTLRNVDEARVAPSAAARSLLNLFQNTQP